MLWAKIKPPNYKLLFHVAVMGAVLLVSGALLGFKIIPDLIEDKIWEKKVLRMNTEQWDVFLKMPFPVTFNVYLFDVQNPDEVMSGAKPVVKEKGPYTYKLNRWKSNITWDQKSDEISYFEYERYQFDEDATKPLFETDTVTLLNIPYNSILLTTEHLMPSAMSMLDPALPSIFGELNDLFVRVKVKDFLWAGLRFCRDGDSENFAAKMVCKQIKNKLKSTKQMRLEGEVIVFASLYYRNDSHHGYFTVKSGQHHETKTGKLTKVNNQTQMTTWLGEASACNQIQGLTSVFPNDVQKDFNFDVFSEDICRTISMTFKSEEVVDDVAAYKFAAMGTTFSYSKDGGGDCFCINRTMNLDGTYGCLFDGVGDLTTCTGGPVLVSFPHLLYGDERYLRGVEGMRPEEGLHETFVLLEPITGAPLKVMKRVQFNMFIRSIDGITALENVTHSLMPVFWIEESLTLPQSYLDAIKYSAIKSVFILKIVRWIVVAVGMSLVFISLFMFFYFKSFPSVKLKI
ncbi:sensory neuron membrane protein 2-like [Cylas formicarius]|uniref:sensory neuron membrane protein 2-like n=1 Tax=Cylas formicarius TaxID=197179 RepID=UPI0029584EFB|nr:sensory neuron membrane protein 2-like [Cylas formicarius]